ncbi:MAG TPA: TonB-dependent receptor, partial [Thermoanaerobaculia bacterium]|nr:TonB-dependent receptor [Thermoanaerobaculia bacterium]
MNCVLKETVQQLRSFVLLALMAAFFAVPAGAQLQTGNLYGLVTDEQGSALSGASIFLTGGGAPQEQKSDDKGAFRFIGLAPGSYNLVVSLRGFTSIEYPDLSISVGHNSQVSIILPAAVTESITVSAEAPLLDERRIATGTDVGRTELEKVPTARDPWSLLASVPGVLLDRINVGGNYSATQSSFVGPGSQGTQAVWSLDGMVITDMTAGGTSPGYFDFDAFEDVQVTTGGTDANIATGGVAINMVTRRGTNQWRGSAHAYYADHNFVSGLSLDRKQLAPASPANNFNAQPAFQEGNRINRVQDAGLEIGGPLVRDHLWLWGSYTDPVTDLLTIDDYQDNTETKAWNIKLNSQLNAGNSATFFAWNDEKTKHGLGASPLRPPETTQNQSRFGDRPTALKLEDAQILSSSLYLDGLVSKVNGGFQLLPEGGDKSPYLDDDSVWHNSYFIFKSSRPQKQGRVNGSGFFNTGSLSHELKFGAGYRVVEVNSLSSVPGGGYGCCDGLLLLTRDGVTHFRGKYTSAFLQDTLTTGRLTANLGLRYDRQQG